MVIKALISDESYQKFNMFDRFFQKEEECPTKKEGANSSTSGTEDLEDQVSPKLEYQEFLLASKKLEEELTYK